MERGRAFDGSTGLNLTGSGHKDDYAYLRQLVLEHSHNVLDPSRDYLLDAKLARLIRKHGWNDLRELVKTLRRTRDKQLETAVADAMTVNETSFFRDNRPFEIIRTRLLPELIHARQKTRELRLWSAACSTGQEPYSLAMLIRENFHLGGWKIRVEGTDYCKEMIEQAKAATYERIEVNRGLPALYLAKYFERSGERWIVKPEIRSMCEFRQLNLGKLPLPLDERYDVILLRNVMLYFGQNLRRRLIAEVQRLLAPDGMLLLGATEQPPELEMWRPEIVKGACFFRSAKSAA